MRASTVTPPDIDTTRDTRLLFVILLCTLLLPIVVGAASAQSSAIGMANLDTQMQVLVAGGPSTSLEPVISLPACRAAKAEGTARSWAGCDLRGADLSARDLRHYDLSNAQLQGANLRQARMSFVNLEGADLTGADLTGVVLMFARLSRAKMSGATIIEADIRLADLRLADLQNAILDHSDLSSAQLGGARLHGASWYGVTCPTEASSGGAPCLTLEQGSTLLAGPR